MRLPPGGDSRAARLLLFWLLAALAVGGVWLAARPPALPESPEEIARQELPSLREAVRAQPASADARLKLMAAHQILGDRIGAWQQLALAEKSSGPLSLIRRARARVAESLGRLEDAASAAERARQAEPEDLEITRESFRLHTLLGDFHRAHAIARETLGRHPGDAAAHALAGEAAFNVADYPAAIRSLRAARQTDPESVTVAVQLGVALLRAEYGKAAATLLAETTRRPVVPPRAWEYLGQARLSQGETRLAAEAFARAEAARAPGGGAAFGAALVALSRGEAAAAEDALRRALARDPEHDAAATTLSQLLRASGRSAEAAAVAGRAALARGEAATAVRELRAAVSLLGNRATPARLLPLLLDLAAALLAAEDGPGAMAALEQAARLAPRDADVARKQVEMAHALFAPQAALRAIDRYARLAPGDTSPIPWWRFRAYRQLQDEKNAAVALAAAAERRPGQPEILTWQARVLLESAPDARQVTAAGEILRRALAAAPSDVEVRSSLAEVCIRQEQWVEAGEHLRRALALDPERGRGRHWLQLAQADRALGLVQEAAWDAARYREVEQVRADLVRARAAAAEEPANAHRLLAASSAALRAGRLREARVLARAAVRVHPRDAAAYQALAAACQRLGRLEDRIVAMEAARSVRTGSRKRRVGALWTGAPPRSGGPGFAPSRADPGGLCDVCCPRFQPPGQDRLVLVIFPTSINRRPRPAPRRLPPCRSPASVRRGRPGLGPRRGAIRGRDGSRRGPVAAPQRRPGGEAISGDDRRRRRLRGCRR
jgi:tetratricopeptide (TPR) repeat protein